MFEPNDTPETATPLELGTTVEARAVQNNPDCFSVYGGPGQSVVFSMENLGEDDCAAFSVTGADGSILYQDTNRFCGREFSQPVVVEGATLQTIPDWGYVLRVPANVAGNYVLTVDERGQVDNVFDFRWLYRLTVTAE